MATVMVAGALIIGGLGSRSNLINETEPPSLVAEIGGVNGLVISHPRNNIVTGDSRNDIEMANRRRIEDGKNRDLLARGESWTGTGREVEVIGYSQENCVQYAKRITGISRSIGYGGRQGINSQSPRVGAVGVEARRYHAVVITKIEGERITVEEANYYMGKITRRVLTKRDFLGFIYM